MTDRDQLVNFVTHLTHGSCYTESDREYVARLLEIPFVRRRAIRLHDEFQYQLTRLGVREGVNMETLPPDEKENDGNGGDEGQEATERTETTTHTETERTEQPAGDDGDDGDGEPTPA